MYLYTYILIFNILLLLFHDCLHFILDTFCVVVLGLESRLLCGNPPMFEAFTLGFDYFLIILFSFQTQDGW